MRGIGPLRQMLENRPLAALVGASALSGAGDWLYLTALPVLVYQRTADPALVGIAAAGRLVPFLVLSMPAGVVADRFSRRSILVISELLRCVAMLLIAWMCVAGANIWWIIGLTIVAAAAGTFSMPAVSALLPELAANDDQLGHSNAVRATLDSLAGVLGPALAGILIIIGGLPIAFALNGISFAVVALAMIICRPLGQPDASSSCAPADGPARPDGFGWRAIARLILGPLALDAAVSFASSAIGILTVLIAVDWLRADESFTGLLNAGAGLGGIAGGVAAGTLINRGGQRGIAIGLIGFLGATIVLGSTAAPLFAVASMAVVVGALVLLDTLNMTSVQRLVPDRETGRAMGILHTNAAVWMIAGVVVPTLCLQTIGIQAAILAPGAVVFGMGTVAIMVHGKTQVDETDRTSLSPAVA